jgi:hypothetical protein
MKENYPEKNDFALANAFINTGVSPVQIQKTKVETKNMNNA